MTALNCICTIMKKRIPVLEVFLILSLSFTAINCSTDNKKKDRTAGQLDSLNRLIQRDSNNIQAYLDRSDFYLKIDKKAEALKDLDKIIKINPDTADVYYRRGIINLDDQPDSAVKDLSKYIQFKPSAAGAYIMRGLAYFNIKEFNKSIKDLNSASILYPDNPTIFFFNSQNYYYLKDLKKSIACLKELLRVEPSSLSGAHSLAERYIMYGDYKNALAAIEELKKQNSDKVELSFLTAVCLVKMKKTDQAINILENVKPLRTSQSKVHLLLSLCLYKKNKEKCLDHFKSYLDAGFFDVDSDILSSLKKESLFKSAIDSFKKSEKYIKLQSDKEKLNMILTKNLITNEEDLTFLQRIREGLIPVNENADLIIKIDLLVINGI